MGNCLAPGLENCETSDSRPGRLSVRQEATAIKLSSLNFETWCLNHPDDHDAKWCRELYPWEVFERTDYDASAVGEPQTVTVAGNSYVITLQNRFNAENGRFNYLVHLRSAPSGRRQQWQLRAWDDLFHLVADPSGYFITLYTEKPDPSKKLLKQFMSGGLSTVESERTLPLSRLLFRSLISYAAQDSLGELARYQSYAVRDTAVRDRGGSIPPIHRDRYEPFLSDSRRLWIIDSFTEEKAHRHAIQLAGQSEALVMVYCHPTFTRHHRCQNPATSVVSLAEFLRMQSPEVHARYIEQARFLINHLRVDTDECDLTSSSEALTTLLKAGQQLVPIHTSDLREAKAGLGIIVRTTADAAYVCACGNLLNAAMNSKLNAYDGSLKLSKEVYSFKAILAKRIGDVIRSAQPDVRVYVEPGGAVYVTVRGVQFSYHAIPREGDIAEHARSNKNVRQEWSGLRLQPVAPLVLRWARALLREEQTTAK